MATAAPQVFDQGNGTIYCVCGGTRGDQQPLIMLASQLKKMGYNIVVAVGPEGKLWTEQYGFEYIEIASFKRIVRQNDGIRSSAETGDFNKYMSELSVEVSGNLTKELDVLWPKMRNDKTCCAFICTSTHIVCCEPVSRMLNIYSAAIWLFPLAPTKDFPPYFIDTRNPATWQVLPGFEQALEYPHEANRALWDGFLDGIAATFEPTQRRASECMGAEKVMPKEFDDMKKLLLNVFTLALPEPTLESAKANRTVDVISAFSEVCVNGGPSDWLPHQKKYQFGWIFDSGTTEGPESLSTFDATLQTFLNQGDEPVYFGWGSMCREHNDELLRAAVSACKILGKRGIVLRGWADLHLDMLNKDKDMDLLEYAKGNILIVDSVSHISLFPKCCCMVTHGGSGTTGAMMRSGKPGIITPCWWDQTFFGDRIEATGMGKRGPHFSKLTGNTLAELIKEVTTQPSYARKAKEISAQIMACQPGEEAAAMCIHNGIVKKSKRVSSLHSALGYLCNKLCCSTTS